MKKFSLFLLMVLACTIISIGATPGETPLNGILSTVGNGDGAEFEKFEVNGVTFEMVRVDGGTFQMGSDSGAPRERPMHPETVGTFYIGKTEVTQRLWNAVMGTNPSIFIGENLPVENVSLFECQEFINRLSQLTGRKFRLPTEAEWEYAARGGNKSNGYTYSGDNNIGAVGWYIYNSGGTTHPVAQKHSNELKLYDMTGNVWEWCADIFSRDYSSPRNSTNFVARGGGWARFEEDCRVTYRGSYSPAPGSEHIGLRLAL